MLRVGEIIRPVKTRTMRCWHGYLSVAKCKWLSYGPADASATPSSLLQKNPEWFILLVPAYQDVLEKTVKILFVCVHRVRVAYLNFWMTFSYNHASISLLDTVLKLLLNIVVKYHTAYELSKIFLCITALPWYYSARNSPRWWYDYQVCCRDETAAERCKSRSQDLV